MNLKHILNKLRYYFGFLLLAFYLTVGFIFIFTNVWGDLVPKGRLLIGTLLILFGSLRFYVAYQRYINRTIRLQEKAKETTDNAAKE